MSKVMRSIAIVFVLGMGFSAVSSVMFVDDAQAERKGYLDRTWNW